MLDNCQKYEFLRQQGWGGGVASCRLQWPKRVSKFIFLVGGQRVNPSPFRCQDSANLQAVSCSLSVERSRSDIPLSRESLAYLPDSILCKDLSRINTYLLVFFSHWSFTIFLSMVTSARDHRRLKFSQDLIYFGFSNESFGSSLSV